MTYNVFGGTLNPTLLLLYMYVCTMVQLSCMSFWFACFVFFSLLLIISLITKIDIRGHAALMELILPLAACHCICLLFIHFVYLSWQINYLSLSLSLSLVCQFADQLIRLTEELPVI